MVNHFLNTFIQVIDSGSFSKAAEILHLSSTAIMKQMNELEAQVGVQLFIRTNHGIRATDAGNSFYHDVKFMVKYSEKAIARAHQAANIDPHMIRIGNSLLYPCKPLLDLWNTISDTYPQFKIKIVPFDHDAPCWPTAYRTLGKDVDVIVGAYESISGSGLFHDVKLGEYRFCVAVSREHPLAKKDALSITDLYGERVAMLRPGTSLLMDEIREYLLAEHQEIQIKDALRHYNIDVFNRCEVNGAVLLTLNGWKDVHPSLVTIPIDWAYTAPFGVLYPPEPSSHMMLFLKALQETQSSIDLCLYK